MAHLVFSKLKQLGVSQHDIAQRLGVRDSTVSQWRGGKREMAPEILKDLYELAYLLEGCARSGGDPQDVLVQWQPTVRITEQGHRDQVVHGGGYPVSPDMFGAIAAAVGDPERHDQLHVQAALQAVAAFLRSDNEPLDPVELYQLRRALKGALGEVESLCWSQVEGIYPPAAGED